MRTREFLKLIIRTKRDRLFYKSIIFFSLILSMLEIAGVSAILPFLNIIQTPASLTTDSRYAFICNLLHIDSARQFLLYAGAALIALYVFRGALSMGVTYMQNYFAYTKQTEISTELLRSYLQAPYAFHLDTNSSILIKNINVEAVHITSFLQQILSLILEVIILFFLTVFLICLQWKLTVSLIVFSGIVYFGVSKKFLNKVKSLGSAREAIQAKAFRLAQQALGNIKSIKIGGKTDFFVDMFQKNLSQAVKIGSYFSTLTVSPKAIIETLVIVGAILLLLAAISVSGLNADLMPLIGVYCFAIYRIVPSINKISIILMNMRFFKVSVDIVGEQIKRIRAEAAEQEKRAIAKDRLREKISIRGLTFRYNPLSEHLFKDVTFEIHKGEKALIIGESGSGKSTLIDLLVGLLLPETGEILYDGIPVCDLNLSGFVGYVPQKMNLLDMDITANIAFGEEEKVVNNDRLRTTLEQVNLGTLTDALDRTVGEDGIKLSGGQRQRIGLARIFYQDKDIIFLDEFSSALDRDNEELLVAEIMRVFSDKTVIAVTHKTYLAPHFDRVFRKTKHSLDEVRREHVFEADKK